MVRIRKCIMKCPKRGRLFKFPRDRESEKRKKWLEAFGMENTTVINLLVCERHFPPDWIKRRLIIDAIPDRNLTPEENQFNCILNCPDQTALYCFPDASPDQLKRDEWLYRLQIVNDTDEEIYACANHFSADLRINSFDLVDGAMPNLNLPPEVIEVIKISNGEETEIDNAPETDKKCVLECLNVDTLLCFPSNEERREEWCRIFGIIHQKDVQLYACSKHFSSKMFYLNNKPKPSAVPDTNLPLHESAISEKVLLKANRADKMIVMENNELSDGNADDVVVENVVSQDTQQVTENGNEGAKKSKPKLPKRKELLSKIQEQDEEIKRLRNQLLERKKQDKVIWKLKMSLAEKKEEINSMRCKTRIIKNLILENCEFFLGIKSKENIN